MNNSFHFIFLFWKRYNNRSNNEDGEKKKERNVIIYQHEVKILAVFGWQVTVHPKSANR
jgi:hypothetical protein